MASQDEGALSIIISDDGVGIFAKISDALHLPDMRQVLFELAKGKLTTDPSKHSGEGVFFTSRMFDSFEISANGLQFNHDAGSPHDWLREAAGVFPNGTAVFMRIASPGSTGFAQRSWTFQRFRKLVKPSQMNYSASTPTVTRTSKSYPGT